MIYVNGPHFHAEQELRRTVSLMWASSTWSGRRFSFQRYQEFARRHNYDPIMQIDFAGSLWVASQRNETPPSTRLKYATDLASIASRLGFQASILRMAQAGLRSSGALLPTHQASPLTPPDLRLLRSRLDTERLRDQLEALMFIMWKSASRYDEAAHVTADRILRITPTQIYLYWADQTKTTRADPHREDMFVIIEHQPEIPESIRNTLANLLPGEQLFPRTVSWFDLWLRTALPERHVTAHSFKAGALSILAQCVSDKRLDPKFMSMLARHKLAQPTLQPTTIRYLRDKAQVCETVGLNVATSMLPW